MCQSKGDIVGTVKTVIGYGIGLAVLGVVLAHMISGYLKVRRDNIQQLARRDSERLQLSVSADYAHSFLGTAVQPSDPRGTDRSTAGGSGPYDQASDQLNA